MTKSPAKKRTGDRVSSIAGKVLRGVKATAREVKSMAASLLGKDEVKGKRGS
jgi:hypothetical protein